MVGRVVRVGLGKLAEDIFNGAVDEELGTTGRGLNFPFKVLDGVAGDGAGSDASGRGLVRCLV